VNPESKPIPPVPVKREESPQVKRKNTAKTDAKPKKSVAPAHVKSVHGKAEPAPQTAPAETTADGGPNVGHEDGGGTAAPSAGSGAASGGRQTGGGSNGSGGGSNERAFGSSDGPRFLRKTTPDYPSSAKKLQKEGNVLLRVTIDERGRPVDVEIVKGAGFGFDEEAVKAVRSSTFVPAQKGGKPIACKVLLPIRFVLGDT
jgi:protein TonB